VNNIIATPGSNICNFNYCSPSSSVGSVFSNNAVRFCLSFKYFNARSVRSKLSSVHSLLYAGVFNIVCISETWLCDAVPDGLLDPNSEYNIFRRDRMSSHPAGGVAIFVNNSIISAGIDLHLEKNYSNKIEVVACSVHSKNIMLNIACVYIAPATDFETFLRVIQCLEYLCSLEGSTIVVGDFNLPKIDWATGCAPGNSKDLLFFNFANDNGLIQMVSGPTRNINTLDLLLVNDPLIISDLAIDVPFCSSDHESLNFSVLIDISPESYAAEPSAIKYSWDNADWDALRNFCFNVDWEAVLSPCVTANDLWSCFFFNLRLGLDKCVPISSASSSSNLGKKKCRPHHYSVRKLITKRKQIWAAKRRSPTDLNIGKYKKCTIELKAAMAAESAHHELQIIRSGNIGRFYKHVNSRLNHKSGIAPILNNSGLMVFTDLEKAESLNEYFAGVGTVDNGIIPTEVITYDSTPDSSTGHLDRPPLSSVHIDAITVFRCISHLKDKSAAGPDGLPPLLLKRLVKQLSEPLALVFRSFIALGSVPCDWKEAIVVPIFKKGASSKMENYRPISLTNCCCKLFEATVKVDLLEFLSLHNLISPAQHGFLAKRSTCTNLLETIDDWTEGLDLKCDTLVVYIDFAKAFDRVSLPKLLYKLARIGISGCLLECLRSLLLGRSQKVRIGKSYSDLRPIISGVPQGSVLGPILFLLFINDIADRFPPAAKTRLFADDLKSSVRVVDDEASANFGLLLEAITNWSFDWQLPLAEKKCNWMTISNRNKVAINRPFKIAECNLEEIKVINDLGISFNNRINFSSHIKAIIAKAKQRVFLLRKSFSCSDPGALILGFKTYVIPPIEYCSQVWSPSNIGEINQIESVQRSFTKILACDPSLTYRNRLDMFGLRTLEYRRLVADLALFYKILHKLITIDVSNSLELDTDSRTRGHSWKVKLLPARINTRLNFFTLRTAAVWNSLSPSTVQAVSIHGFKKCLSTENLSDYLNINVD
jgi:Reverse transcriptase (RNA-dependent DNA polymerase)/Endonuclease-reverse transcriptase